MVVCECMKDIATPVATEGPGQLSRIQEKITDLGPKSAPEPGEAKPKMPDAVTTNRHSDPASWAQNPPKIDDFERCYATMRPGRKPGFPAGFRPGSNR